MLQYYIALLVGVITFILLRSRGKKKKVLNRPTSTDEGPEYKVQYPTGKQFWSTDRTVEHPIYKSAKGIGAMESTTIPKLFKKAKTQKAAEPALRVERPLPAYDLSTKSAPPSAPFDQWHTWTWSEYYDECAMAARAFMALGLQRFDGVNIFGFNCPEWNMAELATIMAGGIVSGIYPSDTKDQVIYKSSHSSAAIAVCTHKKIGLFREAAQEGKLPALKAIIAWDGPQSGGIEKLECKGQTVVICSWKDLKKLSEQTSEAALEAVIDSQKPGHVCSYIYTSGTTGNPKAVMITHDNIIWEASCVTTLLPADMLKSQNRIISFLPLSHVAGAMVDIVCPIILTANQEGNTIVGFARDYDLKYSTIAGRLTTIQPTLFLGVPRVWEKVAEKVKKIGAKVKGVLKKISTFAKKKGLEHAKNCQLGGSGEKPPMYPIAEKLVLNKVKKNLGLNQCRFGFTGAAPISADTLEYFGSLGIFINEVYGMSECTGATTWSTDEAHVWGSCGFTMPGTEVKIFRCDEKSGSKTECPLAKDIFKPSEGEQGEICFRGRHIMAGYMANPALGEKHVAEIKKKNCDAIDSEGWLHSGDKGCMGFNGMLKITGRYKELIIGKGGENIAPVPIEDQIKKICPIISNILMIGDQRKYNVAVVTLKAKGATGEKPGSDELDGEAADLVSGVTTISEACKNDTFIKTITDAIKATNSNGAVVPSNAAKIGKFTILPRDFSVETGEMTPTLKTKRSVVNKINIDVIERMYSSGKDATYVAYAQ